MTPNPDFKVMPLFYDEYLRNGTREKYLKWNLLTHAPTLNGVISNDLE